MSVRTLNKNIFWLTTSLILLCSSVIILNVWTSTTNHAKKQLEQTLRIAQSVFIQVLASREAELFNSAEVLTADFGFKAAIGSQDAPTIDSALLNQSDRIDADLMILLAPDGLVLNSTTEDLSPAQSFPHQALIERTLLEGGASEIILLNGKLYQTILVAVDVPGAPTIAVIGFEMNRDLLERSKNITLLDTTVKASVGNQLVFSASSLNPLEQQNAIDLNEDVSWLQLSLFTQKGFISRSFLLNKYGEEVVEVVLFEDINSILGDFNQLQIKITLIAFLSVILSILVGAVFSKNLADPLKKLAAIANTISRGSYDKEIVVKSKTTEVKELAESFESMHNNVQEREKRIRYQARHDLLTDLQNRYRISELIDERFSQNHRFQAVGANILGFRGVNDVFGYGNGDLCLIEVAKRFKTLGGEAARLNGGEFIWLPKEPVSLSTLRDIQTELERPIHVDDVVMNIKISLAVLNCPQDCSDTESLLKRLNICLDEARQTRGRLAKYQQEFEARYTRRLLIISELKKALIENNGELSLAYQPKLDLEIGDISHVEALIRWHSSKLGFVPPDEFILIAEQAGLIGSVTDYVIRNTIFDAKRLQDNGLDICIAINLSAKDILNENLLSIINKYLVDIGVNAAQLSFEITESDLVSDPQKAVEVLQKFRDAKFTLAIDDFGTGYSSLAYLKSLPVSHLKIDKSFVLALDSNDSDQQIVKTIIDLAHNFDLGIIAEGVESQAALMMLKTWKCDYVQGYHVARPMPLDKLLPWCKENKDKNWFEI